MSWNYRIVNTEQGYSIYEVFYDENGKPNGCTTNPTLDFHVDSIEDIKYEMDVMKKAFELPVINMDDIGPSTKKNKNDKK